MPEFAPYAKQMYLVQFTETDGGEFQQGGTFDKEDTAVQRMQHLVNVERKVTARVLHELHYYAGSAAQQPT